MKLLRAALIGLWLGVCAPVQAAGKWVATPYAPAKVMFEFYLDDPQKIGSALYWVRSLMNPLQAEPYSYSPEDLSIVVVIHGTESPSHSPINTSRIGFMAAFPVV